MIRPLFVKIYILILLTAGVLAGPVCANIKTDVVGTAAYTSNLLGDSTRAMDSYYTLDANVNIYPAAPFEINFNNRYTYYAKLFKLSNLYGGVGFKLIPFSVSSRLNFLINGRFTTQHYRDSMFSSNANFINYSNNNDNYDYGLSGCYRLAPTIHTRFGVAYSSAKYTNYSGADRNTWKFFAGLNMTILGSGSLDIEGGYASMSYRRFADSHSLVDFKVYFSGAEGLCRFVHA